MAAEVEDAHGVPVEVVCVGDAPITDEDRPLVLAAREAITNAAKHSGASTVDVYAEATASGVEVFVRDRGAGFDPDRVAEDRHGVRSSIIGRMERHGGSASVRSTPGEGTEVRLSLPNADHQDRPREILMSLRTVVIVDDHAMFRTGVRAELGTSVDVVAEAADVDQAVAAVLEHQPGGGAARRTPARRRWRRGDAAGT